MTTPILPTGDYDSLVEWLRRHRLGHGAGAGAVLGAYRHDLIVLLEQAAAARRASYTSVPNATQETLEQQASDLDAVIRLVNGDMTAMTAWLPSWRWTAEVAPEETR